jgi:hypothetical protein
VKAAPPAPPARPARARRATKSVPTPAEIRRRTQAIRSRWSDVELSQRSVKTHANGKKYRIDGAETICDPVLLAHIRFARLIVGVTSAKVAAR